MEQKKYNYYVEVGYPSEYPTVYEWNNSYLYDLNNKPLVGFGGEIGAADDWGYGSQISSLFYEGPIPRGIKVRWFSITENQFWEGEYEFETEQLKKLYEDKIWQVIFQKYSDNKNGIFSYTVYVVPGGLVTVWFETGGNVILLGQFQAKKVEMQWEDFYSSTRVEFDKQEFIDMYLNDKYMSEQTRQEIKTHTLPNSDRWRRLMNTYRWKLISSDNFVLKDYLAQYVNAEQYYTYYGDPQNIKRAVPYELQVYLQSPSGELTRLSIEFEQEEIIQAFEKLSKKHPKDTEFTLLIDETSDLKETTMYLITGDDKLEIKATCALENLYIGANY